MSVRGTENSDGAAAFQRGREKSCKQNADGVGARLSSDGSKISPRFDAAAASVRLKSSAGDHVASEKPVNDRREQQWDVI